MARGWAAWRLATAAAARMGWAERPRTPPRRCADGEVVGHPPAAFAAVPPWCVGCCRVVLLGWGKGGTVSCSSAGGGAERRGGPFESGARGTRARVCRRRGVPARPPTSAASEAAAVARWAPARIARGGGRRRYIRRAREWGVGAETGRACVLPKLGSGRTCLSSGVLIISTAALPLVSPSSRGRGGWEGGEVGAGGLVRRGSPAPRVLGDAGVGSRPGSSRPIVF